MQKTSKGNLDQPSSGKAQKPTTNQTNKLRTINFRQRWANKQVKGGVVQKNKILSQSTKRLFRSLQNLQAHLFRKNLSQGKAKIIKIRRSVVQKKKPLITPVSQLL